METIHIGPCKCGGYGQCFDAEAEKLHGTCHLDLSEVTGEPRKMESEVEYNHKGGFRFEIKNPPPAGTELTTTSGEIVVFDEVSIAGMLACTRKSDGSQQLYFPHDLVVPNNRISEPCKVERTEDGI